MTNALLRGCVLQASFVTSLHRIGVFCRSAMSRLGWVKLTTDSFVSLLAFYDVWDLLVRQIGQFERQ